MIAVDVIEDRTGLLALRPVWNELFAASGASVFTDFDWQLAWWDSLAGDAKLLILRAREGGETLGLAPFMIDGTASQARVTFLGAPMSDYCDVLVPDGSPQILGALLDKLLAIRGRGVRVVLERIRDHSPAAALAGLLGDREAPWDAIPGETRYAYDSEAFEGGDCELEREMVRKAGKRRFSGHFSTHVSLERLHHPQQIANHLPNLFLLHAKRWGDSKRPSVFLQRPYRTFFHRLVDGLAHKGMLSLSVLWYEERPVAYSVNFEQARTSFGYTLAFSSYHHRSSPGSLLLYKEREAALGAGFTRIDYLRGDEGFKQSLANTSYSTFDIQIYENKLARAGARTYRGFRDSRAGEWARTQPWLRNTRDYLAKRHSPPGESSDGPAERLVFARLDACPKAFDQDPSVLITALDDGHLPLLGELYGYLRDSEPEQRVRLWLQNGAECIAALVAGRPVAAGWVFPRGHEANSCQITASTTDDISDNDLVFSQIVDSPAAEDYCAFPALVAAFWWATRDKGQSAFLCAPARLLSALPSGFSCHPVLGAD